MVDHGVAQHDAHSNHAGHDAPDTHGGHGAHDGHTGHSGHDKHAGHDPEMFRRRFWLSLALTIPIVVTSEMVMDWFGYRLDFPGIELGRPGARHVRVLCAADGRSSPAGSREVRDRRAGDDAADLDGDHGRLRRLAGDEPRSGSTSTSGGSWPPW